MSDVGDELWDLYDDDPSQDDCDHDDYDADIITGDATCHRCSYRWHMSDEEIAAEHARIERYQEWKKRERRREWFRAVARWFSGFFPRRRKAVDLDDEIPF